MEPQLGNTSFSKLAFESLIYADGIMMKHMHAIWSESISMEQRNINMCHYSKNYKYLSNSHGWQSQTKEGSQGITWTSQAM